MAHTWMHPSHIWFTVSTPDVCFYQAVLQKQCSFLMWILASQLLVMQHRKTTLQPSAFCKGLQKTAFSIYDLDYQLCKRCL